MAHAARRARQPVNNKPVGKMMLSNVNATLLWTCLFLLLSVANILSAFRCYVCDSKHDIECTENLPRNTNLVSQDCKNITGAKYCIKTTNIYSGEFGTKRFCAANDHGSYCKYIRQPTGDREYRSCVLTCTTENCNRATALLDRQTILYIAPTLILLFSILITTLTCNLHPKLEYHGRTQ